jgi:glycosyltransferase involved in cell wall biosynthesis
MLDRWPMRGQGLSKRLKKELDWRFREKNVVQQAACVLFTTERERRLSLETVAMPKTPTRVIGYGASFSASNDESAGRIPELAQRTFALFLGRLHPKKNPDLLLRAWAKSGVSEWILVFAGPGENRYRQHLMDLAQGLGLQSQILFLDFVDGARKAWLLRNAQWFLLPSSHENFGVAVLEAIQHGCPVAISDQVALADEFPASSPVLPVDLDRWTTFMKTNLRDRHYRSEQKLAQAAVASDRFDIDKLAASWSAVLRDIFGPNRET